MLYLATIKNLLHLHHPAHPTDMVIYFISGLLIFIPLAIFLYALILFFMSLISGLQIG